MSRWISIFCFVLAVLNICKSSLPNGVECPVEVLASSNVNQLKMETALEYQEKINAECPCVKRSCLPLCCPLGYFINKDEGSNCSAMEDELTPYFPPHYDSWTLEERPGELQVNDLHMFWRQPCHRNDWVLLEPEFNPEDEFKLLENGSIYLPVDDRLIDFTEYCLVAITNTSVYGVVMCFADKEDTDDVIRRIIIATGSIISIPFLIVTYIVYAVIPELKNMHGATIRGYVAPMTIAFTSLALANSISNDLNDNMCKLLAFVIHFSFLASFFWLNVMCFDIWWTFGGFRSLQGSVRQRERKKFSIYSAYAWGCATLITGICLIMDLVPSIPKSYIRPEFGDESCWFKTTAAVGIYFYLPMGLTVVCNICLFVSTAMRIIQHKKDTAHHLKGMDSRRHDVNKQWFNLYLKLFIVMGINWSMEIISWFFKDKSPGYVWYLTDLANTLQGVIIFVIFVWKDKIKRLLLKRLGCKDRNFQSGNSTRSAYHSSTSKSCMTVMAPLQEKSNPYSERTKTTTDESECV